MTKTIVNDPYNFIKSSKVVMNRSNISDHMRKDYNPHSCVVGMLYFFFWVFQFSETVQHNDKFDEFQLGFVKHGTESQGRCQIAFQASPVSSLIVNLVIPFNGRIA